MNDILGRIFAAIMMPFALFLAIMSLMTGVDRVVDAYITNKATSFVDVCRTTGQINPENYEMFCNSIYRIGVYDIELCHGQRLALWSEEDGGYVTHKEYYTDEILNHMYETDPTKNVSYLLNNGDYVKITIRKENQGFSGGFYKFFLNRSNNSSLLVNYSGVVGSNGLSY